MSAPIPKDSIFGFLFVYLFLSVALVSKLLENWFINYK